MAELLAVSLGTEVFWQAMGAILLVVLAALALFYKVSSQVNGLQDRHDQLKDWVGDIAKDMKQQKIESNKINTDLALIKQEIGYTKQSVQDQTKNLKEMRGELAAFMRKMDEELVIHHQCDSYQHIKKKV